MHQRSFVPMENTATATTTSSRSFEIVRRTMLSLVLLVVLIGAVIAVAWLVMNPRPPTFRLDSLSLYGLPNASDTSFPPQEPHGRIQLTATNPNQKLSVVIQDVNLWLALAPHEARLPLSTHNGTSSSEYNLNKRGSRVLTFDVKVDARPGRGKRWRRTFPFIKGEDPRKGPARMSVSMEAQIKFMSGCWPSKRAWVDVGCENLSVELSSSGRVGKLKDGGKDCWVHFD